jgi:hypothetical protein
LALVEVHLSSLGKLFSWLADHSRRFPQSRFFAGLDYAVGMRVSGEFQRTRGDAQDIVGALLEAGAAGVTDSPRRINSILALAEKYSEVRCHRLRPTNEDQSIVDWAWAQLPWQSERAGHRPMSST